MDSNSCGAVAEDSAKTALWAVFSSAACVIPPAPTKNSSVVMTLEFLFAEDGVAALGGGQDALSLVWRGFIASLS